MELTLALWIFSELFLRTFRLLKGHVDSTFRTFQRERDAVGMAFIQPALMARILAQRLNPKQAIERAYLSQKERVSQHTMRPMRIK